MAKVFCIAIEGETIGGSEWRRTAAARDHALAELTTATKCVCIPFEMDVPDNATPDEITELVDDTMWTKNYVGAPS